MTFSYAVDVSSHQDAHQPWKSFGVHMGFAKASEGERSRDPWFARHIADIQDAGLVPAAYHFAWPNQDVAKEAANYIAAVRSVASRAPFVHALDLEPYPNGAKNYTGRSDAQIRAWATAWVAAVRRAYPGQRVLAYTPRDNYGRHFPAGADGYWYPAYPVQGRSFAQAATIARPSVGGRPVWGWQFTSVPRDQTVIYMSPAALAAWAAGTTQEDDMPISDDDVRRIAHQVVTGATGMTGPGTTTQWAVSAYLAALHRQGAALTAQVAALTATVAAMAQGGGLTAAEITAAAQAGAQAALAQLGDALTTKEG